MTTKDNRLKVNDLDINTIKRYASELRRLERSGITLTQAKKMTDDELKVALNSKAKSMSSTRRLHNQMSYDSDRRGLAVEQVLKTYEFKDDNEKIEVRKTFVKTSGNIFAEVVDKLESEYDYKSKREVELHAKELLDIDYESDEYYLLDDYEKDVYLEYGSF